MAFQFNYASQILFVAVLTFAKISVAQLIEAIKPQRPVLLACRGLMIVIVTWAVTSILALSFQCSLPDPWDFASGRCINQVSQLSPREGSDIHADDYPGRLVLLHRCHEHLDRPSYCYTSGSYDVASSSCDIEESARSRTLLHTNHVRYSPGN